MKILKMKQFWIALITVAAVASGVTYFTSNRIKISFENDENMESGIIDPVNKKISFAKGAEEPFKKGHEFLRENKLDDALRAFERAAQLSPDTALVHYWVGMTYSYKNEPEKAIAHFKKVLEIEPENYRALAMIGRTLARNRSKIDQAITYLNDSLSINPDFAEARFDLARMYALKGDMKRTLAEFGIIFRAERKYALYHYELGRILESAKAVERSKREYQRALQLNPGFTNAKEALDKLN
jgi:tetratricopeptide (TPR) repeat protein